MAALRGNFIFLGKGPVWSRLPPNLPYSWGSLSLSIPSASMAGMTDCPGFCGAVDQTQGFSVIRKHSPELHFHPCFALQMPITEATSQAITSVSLERGLWELGIEELFIIQNSRTI